MKSALLFLALSGAACAAPAGDEAPRITGRYDLSDGRELNVMMLGGHLVARIERLSAVRLKPDGPLHYVSDDGRMRLEAMPEADGHVARVRLTLRVGRQSPTGE